MSAGRVTVVVVTYNSGECLTGSLGSARRCVEAGIAGECIVVDNRSTDGTVERIRAEHGWCTLVESRDNLGFGRACNIALGRSSAPYALLLNPDASLPPEDLERLVAFLHATPRAGAAVPAIRQKDGRWQFAGGLPTPRSLLLPALGRRGAQVGRRVIQPGQRPFRTDWVCGAVVLLRREMLEEVGGFDPRYFMYFEETDLWVRAQHRGWELWALGEAVATHVQAASARCSGHALFDGCIAEHYFRSRFRYLTRHHGWPAAAATELAELAMMTGRAAHHALAGRELDRYWTRLRAPVLGRTFLETGR